jgi:hypothetical protein
MPLASTGDTQLARAPLRHRTGSRRREVAIIERHGPVRIGQVESGVRGRRGTRSHAGVLRRSPEPRLSRRDRSVQGPLGRVRTTLSFDLFNTLNDASTLRQYNDAVTTAFRRPLEIVAPRLVAWDYSCGSSPRLRLDQRRPECVAAGRSPSLVSTLVAALSIIEYAHHELSIRVGGQPLRASRRR